MQYKAGDFVFSEFELKQIIKIEHGRITDMSCGLFSFHANSFNDEIFPLEMSVKVISGEYMHWENRVRAESRPIHLNWPDIHRWFVSHWADTCRIRENREKSSERCKALAEFCQGIIGKCKDFRCIEVGGVSIFRQ